jgi:hypothetical protein
MHKLIQYQSEIYRKIKKDMHKLIQYQSEIYRKINKFIEYDKQKGITNETKRNMAYLALKGTGSLLVQKITIYNKHRFMKVM